MPTVEGLGPLYSQTNPPGIVRLSEHLLARFPGTHSGGWYNPKSSLSGGGPSPHRVTQALDVMCNEQTARQIIRYMVSIAASVNLQQVIAWHEIITAARWGEGIRFYPAGDHSDGNGHAHIHVSYAASRAWNPTLVGNVVTTPPTPAPPPVLWRLPSESEDDMDNVATIPWPQDGALHHCWVDGAGQLGHRWESATGWHFENIGKIVGAGKFKTGQKPHLYVAPNGAIVAGAFGADGVYNCYANTGHGWVPQTMALA